MPTDLSRTRAGVGAVARSGRASLGGGVAVPTGSVCGRVLVGQGRLVPCAQRLSILPCCERRGGSFFTTTECVVTASAKYLRTIRGRSAGKVARATPLWVDAITGESAFSESAVVKQQCRPPRLPGGIAVALESALTTDIVVVRRFEQFLVSAPSAVQRCMSGFIVLLTFLPARASELLRCRGISLTRDAIVGQILTNTPKGVLASWSAPRCGLGVDDWAGLSTAELPLCDPLGPDCYQAGFNASIDAWCQRRARIPYLGRALRAMLVTKCGLSTSDAALHGPHGCRWVLVTAGRHLRRQGN